MTLAKVTYTVVDCKRPVVLFGATEADALDAYTTQLDVHDQGPKHLTDECNRMLRVRVAECRMHGASDDFVLSLEEMLFGRHRSVFRLKLGWDDPAQVPPLQVTLIDGAVPPSRRPYIPPATPTQLEWLRQHLKELVDCGVIRKSDSPWAAMAMLVAKPDGTWRLVVDARYVNSQTLAKRYAMHDPNNSLAQLGRATVFASFDWLKGYWQIKLDEDSQQYYAFMTHFGKFEYLREPMGGCDSAGHFQA